MNFITGNGFRDLSHFILDEHGFRQNKSITNELPIFFVKTDYIDYFFSSDLLPNYRFKLITHNSDYNINNKHLGYLGYHYLDIWLAQNVNFIHDKLIPIPIGIANPEWPHGDITILQKIIDTKYKKEKLMYANFNIETNPVQRKYCLSNISKEFVENNISFEAYLTKTAKSYFSICPLGNGIDSHRIWESLYLKTIPIAETTVNIKYLIDRYNLPIILINDWSELTCLQLNSQLYYSVIANFDYKKLNLEYFTI